MTQAPAPIDLTRPLDSIPPALLASSSEFPEAVDYAGLTGVHMKVLMANVEAGVFVVRIRFSPGTQLATHAHTGAVFAWTMSGEWSYLEYSDRTAPCRAGDFLYEPPGSVHTLKVADDAGDTDVFFVIFGAMLITDEAGNIVAVFDAQWQLENYTRQLTDDGLPVPGIIVGGASAYHRQA